MTGEAKGESDLELLERVAEVLDVPVGTAKSRLRRAREALAEKITALEDDPARAKTTLANLDAWATSLRQALVTDDLEGERILGGGGTR